MDENMWWWREFPERDVEYVRWYPPDIAQLDPEEVWAEDAPRFVGEAGCYIHIPFCEAICPFCPFHKSLPPNGGVEQLVDAIVSEISLYRSHAQRYDKGFSFVFFGGGTPSILAPVDVRRILDALHDCFGLHGPEVTLEANPGHISREKLEGFREAGVTRPSFGIQSYNQRYLARIGSHHSAKDSLEVVERARQAGFDNTSIDLLFSLPGQTLDDWREELRTAVQTRPAHISTYSLKLDPEAGLGRALSEGRVPAQPSDEEDLEMSKLATAVLSEAGYKHYASCASCGHDFCLPGFESQYETLHWQAPQAEYVGFGPAAYSFANGHVYTNLFDFSKYAEAVSRGRKSIVAGKKLTQEDHKSRFLVMGMKTLAVSDKVFRASFGESIEAAFPDGTSRLLSQGLVRWDGDILRVTELGRYYVDNISKAFYNPANHYVMQPLEPMLEEWTAGVRV